MAAPARKEQMEDQPLRRMNSITRKLHHQLFHTKLSMFISFDLLITLLLFFIWVLDTEFRTVGEFNIHNTRTFASNSGFWGIEYIISDENGNVLAHENFSRILFFILVLLGALIIVEIVSVAIRWHGESKKIRRAMNPINEIALKADAMSRMSFTDAIYGTEGASTEESYHRLEEAIRELNPDQESMPSLGDTELQGIEAAMNNLLRRMHESYQQQARFVNDASHELRTPIAVIQGYANMLDRWGREDESVLNESITAITHEADHMNQLVEQLLFLARGDSGRTKLKQEPINLPELMEEIYEESLMIDEKHPYRMKRSKRDITIIGDPMLLKQSVRILIDNAAKYTKVGDDITLSVGITEKNEPYLQVQDSGIGMAESDVEHMFERFYRSDEAREIKGTGLGLAIAKWIVDRHKGHFEILSRTELGTRIRLVLPVDCITELGSSSPKKEQEDPSEEANETGASDIDASTGHKAADPEYTDPGTVDPKTTDPKTVDPKTVDPKAHETGTSGSTEKKAASH